MKSNIKAIVISFAIFATLNSCTAPSILKISPAKIEALSGFSEGLSAFKEDGRWGFIQANGTIAIKPMFAAARRFSEGFAAVKVSKKWGGD